ncbi:MAG: arsenate reductase ArsC [bacterium]
MSKTKVLFICVHNSARSQMAEAFLNKLAPEDFFARSAGIAPGELNQVVVEAMKEVNIDISGNKTKNALDFLRKGEHFDYVITVCDEAESEKCPSFPAGAKKLHWSFRDPSGFKGSPNQRLNETRLVRDEIKSRIEDWLEEVKKK